jgi:hypothetical protein
LIEFSFGKDEIPCSSFIDIISITMAPASYEELY